MSFFSKRHFTKIMALSMLLVFSFITIAFGSTNLKYLALGDSLAFGVTPTNTQDKSYTDIIAEKLAGEGILNINNDYENLGVPGYKTTDVYGILQNPYYIEKIKSADIITLDVGANDLLSAVPILIADPSLAPSYIESVTNNIGRILDSLNELKKDNAKIYIMGYYNAFNGYDEYMGQPISEEMRTQLDYLVKQFNAAIEAKAADKHVRYVSVYETMNNHLDKYLPVANIHPTVSGYRAIAKEFWDIIKIDFLRN